LLAAIAMLVALRATAQEAAVVDVLAERNGDLIDVRALAVVRASLAVVWGTLTDYERLPEFIPGIETSRIIDRQGATITVAQTGQARFLFLTLPIAVTLQSTERPPHVVEVRRIAGSVRHLQGRYEAEQLPDRKVRLRWIGSVSLHPDLPPLIGMTLARLSIQEQFQGMVREIENRAGQRLSVSAPARGDR
jgi:ribosome-associated toxin RatA of RatAB toxin-antitoxin module